MQAIPCDMTGGSSGRPWLADFSATTGKGIRVSVNGSLDGPDTDQDVRRGAGGHGQEGL